jgi:hypothetical protein
MRIFGGGGQAGADPTGAMKDFVENHDRNEEKIEVPQL